MGYKLTLNQSLEQTPQDKLYYYPHFTDEKIEYQQDTITCPRAHSW